MLAVSAAPTELNPLLSVFTQGSVRAFGSLATLGFAGVSCLKALIRENYYIVQRLKVVVNFDEVAPQRVQHSAKSHKRKGLRQNVFWHSPWEIIGGH